VLLQPETKKQEKTELLRKLLDRKNLFYIGRYSFFQ
jgi:hypothetical protein